MWLRSRCVLTKLRKSKELFYLRLICLPNRRDLLTSNTISSTKDLSEEDEKKTIKDYLIVDSIEYSYPLHISFLSLDERIFSPISWTLFTYVFCYLITYINLIWETTTSVITIIIIRWSDQIYRTEASIIIGGLSVGSCLSVPLYSRVQS